MLLCILLGLSLALSKEMIIFIYGRAEKLIVPRPFFPDQFIMNTSAFFLYFLLQSLLCIVKQKLSLKI